MNTDLQDTKHSELTEKIIKFFYRVYNTLGYGFLEKVYENAMMIFASYCSWWSDFFDKSFALTSIVGERK